MKYSGKDFRSFYKRIVAIEINEKIRETIKDFPGAKSANFVYAYGYIDHDAGFTFEVLASGKQSEKSGLFTPREGNDDISVKLRAGAIDGLEIYFFNETRSKLYKKFADKIEMIENYNESEDIEQSRQFGFLDESWDEYYVDDVGVFLARNGCQLERCWVRINGLDSKNHVINGELLNEPNQDFGCHIGDTIPFFVQETEDKHIICISNMNTKL